ncbi:MAG: hypothetical protein ACRDVW_01595 [Acidimicrobiales bacterium]
MAVAVIVSFRLGGTDGVSIEASKWGSALQVLGFEVRTAAGEGPVDDLVPGLAIAARQAPAVDHVERALEGADLVVVENLCSLPLNPPAAEVVAQICAGRPAVLHHHDLAWQRPDLGDAAPPDDPSWRHVTINELSRRELAARGIEATTLYNRFDSAEPAGRRDETRAALGLVAHERLFLQPTRALPRKNVAGGLELARRLGATYWLLGPAEDGYGSELARLVAEAAGPVLLGPGVVGTISVPDAYAACDLVLLPSSWEGFGNPTVESAIHHRPLCIGPYPVALELAEFGFDWFALDDVAAIGAWLDEPDRSVLERNWAVADSHFSIRDLPDRLAKILATLPVRF